MWVVGDGDGGYLGLVVVGFCGWVVGFVGWGVFVVWGGDGLVVCVVF